MNNNAVRNRIVRIAVSITAAVALLGVISLRPGAEVRRQASISTYHAAQVADGSETNGGKGGKGGAKVTGQA